MRLTIYAVQNSDFTTYKCVAKNPRGESDGSIRLYGESIKIVYAKAHAPQCTQQSQTNAHQSVYYYFDNLVMHSRVNA